MNDEKKYDIFLSYNSLDHAYVERVAKELQALNCSSFIDRWYLTPGHDWVVALEQALQSSRSVAVFLGPHEMGRWQQRERSWAVDRAAEDENFPVIPVLLPGCEPPLGFLKQRMWIDLRDDPTSKVRLDALAAAIRGERVDLDGQPKTQVMICPYRGLLAFREEDAEFFFGRDLYQQQLLSLIQRESLVAVVGASGSGKSSLVSAGLVPELRKSSDGQVWDVTRMVPNVDPLYSLAEALVPLIDPELSKLALERELNAVANDLEQEKPTTPLWSLVNAVLRQQPGTQRLLLFVDQWEELYTNCESTTRRERFIRELLEATSRQDSPLSVVLTVRGDFYNEILRDRPLLDRVQSAELKLGPMNNAELRSVIEGPAKNVGLTFQDGLADRILKEAGDEPENLPLLEFALEELWKRREGIQLTHAGYEHLGRQQRQKGELGQGVKESPLSRAIATYAEGIYHELTPIEQQSVPALFRKFVRAGSKTEEDTRRRVVLSELNDLTRRVVRKLADKRLLITKGLDLAENASKTAVEGRQGTAGKEQPVKEEDISSTVEVAHEELLRRWGRLKEWINEDRQFLLWRSRIELKVEEYRRDGSASLLKGRQLQESRNFYPARKRELEKSECQFLDASNSASLRFKLIWLLSSCMMVIIVAIVAYAWYDYDSNQKAERKKQDQEAEARIKQQEVDDWVGQLLLAREGVVDFHLDRLEPDAILAIKALRSEFKNDKRGHLERANAAYALVRYQAHDSEQLPFLLNLIPSIPADEGPNLITALSLLKHNDPDQFAHTLKQRMVKTSSDPERNRFLAVQLSLGITSEAASVCKLRDDPAQRTSFILGFKDFPGDLKRIAQTTEATKDADLRSALCAGIGGLGIDGAVDTQLTLKELYQNAQDGGTLSAARWALLQQGLSEEKLAELLGPRPLEKEQEQEWYVIEPKVDQSQPNQPPLGITMVKIPENRFALGNVTDNTNPPNEKDQPAIPIVCKSFWMSDQEISVGQFEALAPHRRAEPEQDVDAERVRLLKPVANVTWYDAVEYCNRLSKSEDMFSYYQVRGTKPKIEEGIIGFGDDFQVTIIGGNGYRLATEVEWEYACRALTTTQYNFGNDANLLDELTVYSTRDNTFGLCGSKLPNGWGLFDMHGNADEWCWDQYGSDSRVLRGGSFDDRSPLYLRSANRFKDAPGDHDLNVGFRICRTP